MQDRGTEDDFLSNLQNCSEQAIQGKEAAQELYRSRLRSEALGNSEEEQLLPSTRKGADETLLHNLQASHLYRVHCGSQWSRIRQEGRVK